MNLITLTISILIFVAFLVSTHVAHFFWQEKYKR